MDATAVSPTQTLLDFYTTDAKVFKAISKILEKNFIEATFIVTEHGIFIQESSTEPNVNVSVIFEVVLRRQKFLTYYIPTVDTPGAVICLGFSTTDFKTALDRITKTDGFRMYVLASNPDILHMEITGGSGGNKSYKFITLKKTKIGHVIPPNYSDHIPTVVILPSQFKKATTDAHKNSKVKVKITAQAEGIMLEGTGSQIKGLKDYFGKWVEGQPETYAEYISTQKLHSFSEIATPGITKTIQIYTCPDGRPLKISADAGSMGSISIYLQPEVSN